MHSICAKKVLSCIPGLIDFALELVNCPSLAGWTRSFLGNFLSNGSYSHTARDRTFWVSENDFQANASLLFAQ